MHASRLFSFVAFLFGALVICVHASPIVAPPAQSLAVRSSDDLLDILLDLKAEVLAKVALLDGKTDPVAICADIVAEIDSHDSRMAELGGPLDGNGTTLGQIVADLVSILRDVMGGSNSPTVSAQMGRIVDPHLANLISTGTAVVPGLLGRLTAALQLTNGLDLTDFPLTAAACAL